MRQRMSMSNNLRFNIPSEQPESLKDYYKADHRNQYPSGTSFVYSNGTFRKSRIPGSNEVVFFGLQFFVKQFIQGEFQRDFFEVPKEIAIARYSRLMDHTLGKGVIKTEHIGKLHDLGYMPIRIKAVKEGTLVPVGVPCFTVCNTHGDEFFWVTNFLETLISAEIWMPCTSATTAFRYRVMLDRFCEVTGGIKEFVPWQGHDFSFRGMAGRDAARMSGAAHLLSFFGTDTIPAIPWLEAYYNADVEKEIVGGSVFATEHSVMCMGTKEAEFETYDRLINRTYPSEAIVSIVSDTWDLWNVVTNYLPRLKDSIMARKGKIVIRPDSGDPVKIIVGDKSKPTDSPAYKGLIELLWEIFGGTETERGFKQLDPHIGAIYGDSITVERCHAICNGLMEKGFSSTNMVFGIGSFTYQFVTRDTYGFAIKATYGEVNGEEIELFKDPITDDGTKRSAKGLLMVYRDEDGRIRFKDQCTWEEERQGMLEVVYENGQLVHEQSLSEIRGLLEEQRKTRNMDDVVKSI